MVRTASLEASIVIADVAGFTALTERLERRGAAGNEIVTTVVNGVLDRVLAEVAPAAGAILKFGGDSASVLLTGRAHRARALALALRMRDSLSGRSLVRVANLRGVRLDASIGVASGRVWLHVAAGELIPAGAVVTDALACQAAARAGEVRTREADEVIAVVHAPGVSYAPPPVRSGLPAEIVALLPRSPATFAEHRRPAMGFVRLNWSPGVTVQRRQVALERALGALLESCDRHGVSFLQSDIDVDGCKLLLAAGALQAADRAEERLAAVLTETVVAPPSGLQARAGMARGGAFIADIGGGGVAGVTLMSDRVNVAARLSEMADAGTVLATAEATDRLPVSFARGSTVELAIRGRRDPIAARTLSAPVTTMTHAAPTAPLIGRETEMQRLRAAVRRGGRITLAGPAGIGKSRLLRELAHGHDGSVLRVSGAVYARAVPYLAVRAPLRELLGLDLDEVLRGVRPQSRRARVHSVVLERLGATLSPGSLVLVDDGHWLDEASRALLDAIAQHAPSAGWAVVEARRGTPDGAEDVALGPLSAAATKDLVDALIEAAERGLIEPEKHRVATLAAGHPLICEELVAAAGTPGRLAGAPETAEALLGARLDGLAPADRRLVRELAVLGPRVELDIASRLVAIDRAELDKQLVAARGLLEPAGAGTVRFRHDLVREVAYEGLPFTRRRDLHARALGILEDRGAVPELLSAHAHAGGDLAATWRWSRVAGERALEAAAPLEATQFLQRAAAAGAQLRAEPDARRAVLEQLAEAQERIGALEAAARTLGRARALAGADPILRARLCFRSAELHERRGHYSAALRWITRARQAVDGAPDDDAAAVEVQLDRFAGAMRLRQGRPRDGLSTLLRAQAGAEALGLRAEQAETALLLSWAYSELGDPRQADVRDVAVPIFTELDDDVGLAKALTNRGSDAYFDGDWERACEDFAAAAAACRRVGDWTHLPYAWANIGEIRVRQGRLVEVRGELEEAARLWTSAGYSYGIGMSNLYLGFGEMYAGALKAASARFANAERALRASASGSLGEVQAAWVELHARRGDAAAAHAALAQLGEPEGPIEAARRELAQAHAALAAGDRDNSAASAMRAAALAGEAGLPYEELCALGICAHADDARRIELLRARLGVVRELAIHPAGRSPGIGVHA